MIIDIIYWLFFIWLWSLILKYRKNVKGWTWNFVWAEHYLWRWWTYFVIILIWLWIIFYWVIYPFGWFSSVLDNDYQEEQQKKRNNENIRREISE